MDVYIQMGDTERQEPHHSLFSCSDIYTEGGKKNGRVCIDGRHREREEAPHPLLFSCSDIYFFSLFLFIYLDIYKQNIYKQKEGEKMDMYVQMGDREREAPFVQGGVPMCRYEKREGKQNLTFLWTHAPSPLQEAPSLLPVLHVSPNTGCFFSPHIFCFIYILVRPILRVSPNIGCFPFYLHLFLEAPKLLLETRVSPNIGILYFFFYLFFRCQSCC